MKHDWPNRPPTKAQARIVAQLVWNDFVREHPVEARRVMEFQDKLRDLRRGASDTNDGE